MWPWQLVAAALVPGASQPLSDAPLLGGRSMIHITSSMGLFAGLVQVLLGRQCCVIPVFLWITWGRMSTTKRFLREFLALHVSLCTRFVPLCYQPSYCCLLQPSKSSSKLFSKLLDLFKEHFGALWQSVFLVSCTIHQSSDATLLPLGNNISFLVHSPATPKVYVLRGHRHYQEGHVGVSDGIGHSVFWAQFCASRCSWFMCG